MLLLLLLTQALLLLLLLLLLCRAPVVLSRFNISFDGVQLPQCKSELMVYIVLFRLVSTRLKYNWAATYSTHLFFFLHVLFRPLQDLQLQCFRVTD
jgi:hypothetical protein